MAEGHEVELSPAGAVVAREDGVAEALEVLGGDVLAAAAEEVAWVGGHAGEATPRDVTDEHPFVTFHRCLSAPREEGAERVHLRCKEAVSPAQRPAYGPGHALPR